MTKRQNRKYGGKIRPVTKLWTTREGEEIRICDMTEQHLRNAIKCLKKNHEQMLFAANQALTIVSGEEAVHHIEYAIKNMEQEESMHSAYLDLSREAERRGLVIL